MLDPRVEQTNCRQTNPRRFERNADQQGRSLPAAHDPKSMSRQGAGVRAAALASRPIARMLHRVQKETLERASDLRFQLWAILGSNQ